VELDLDRFLALVRRELGATQARVVDVDEAAVVTDITRVLRCPIPDGRVLVATFDAPPEGRDSKQRRLEMLASTFDSVVEETSPGRRSRPPVKRALRDELQALCDRAAAVNALVVDANSPVVWGAAQPAGLIPVAQQGSDSRMAEEASSATPETQVTVASRRALHVVRGLAEIGSLRKGKHVRHVERAGEGPLLAHSFAGIYLLVVVFVAPFDELRAERAILESLPRIERLVLALPPLDPSPDTGAGVVALRRPRRR
jgi:hypothetical protein